MSTKTQYRLLVLAVLLTASGAQAQASSNESVVVIGKSAAVEPGRTVDAAIVIGDDLIVGGKVDGVAAAIGGDVHVLPGAQIDGATLAIGGALRIEPGAAVEGPRVQVAPGDFSSVASQLSQARFEDSRRSVWTGPFMRLAQVAVLFMVGVFLVLLAPRQVQNLQQTISGRAGLSVLVGVVTMLGLVPFCILLGVSLIGIPLIPAAIAGILAIGAFGMTGLAVKLGYSLRYTPAPKTLFGAMVRGMVLLGIAVAIPILGGALLFVASACGIGAVFLSRFGSRASSPPGERAEEASTHVAVSTTAQT